MRAYFFPWLVLGAFALSASTSAIAVTVESTFIVRPENPLYSNPANWSPPQVPDNSSETSYNVTVRDVTVTADIDATISNFIFTGGSAIQVEANLTVTGTTLNIATTLSIPILVNSAPLARDATFDAGFLSTFSNDTLTGKYWICAAKNTVAALKFNGANVVKLQNAELSLVCAGGARILDEQGHDGMRNLEEIDSASWLTLSGQDFISGATFSNYGRLILSASFDGPGTTFTIPGAFTNFDPATHTLNGGIFQLENNFGVTTPLILRFNGADIVTNAASISIAPPGAIEDLAGNDALRNFSRNTATGEFALIGHDFTTGGDFTNDGRLLLFYSIFKVTGALTNWNPSTATLTGGTYDIPGGIVKFNGADIVHNAAAIWLARSGRIEDENGNDGLRHFTDNQAGGTFRVGLDYSFSASGDFTNAGTVGIESFEIAPIPLPDPGLFTVPPGHHYQQSAGETRVDGRLNADLTTISGGILSGFGLIHGDVFLGQGTLHPGNGLTIDGSLSLSATSHFVATVGRINNDHMSVAGATSLAGELVIEIASEFPIGSADTFTILTSSSPLTGSFSNIASGGRLTSIDGHGSFRVTYAGNAITLSGFEGVPPSAQLLNISTRAFVSTGNHAVIGGFIISGTEPKRAIVRGIGPSLAKVGVGGSLQDPKLELRGSTGALIAANDNWKDTQQSEIEATGLAPREDAESAIVVTLAPGAYTIILRGQNDLVGVGLVEVYDLGMASKLANISTRGFVDPDNVMIAGFIAGGGLGDDEIVLRAIGPDLQSAGVPDPLPDPTLELRDQNGVLIVANDDWVADTVVGLLGLTPNRLENSVLRVTLTPGSYTAIARGKSNDSGTALVEVYDLHR